MPNGTKIRDRKIDEAKAELRKLITNNPQGVFYVKQLQVRLEKEYYHWITGFALAELVQEEFVGVEERVLPSGTGQVKFVFNKKNRRRQRQIKKMLGVIDKGCQPEIAHACGNQAEILFLVALMEYKFELMARETREYDGRRWEETNENLDYIVKRDGVAYGVEVKNTWDYIPKEELELKLKMCGVLGLRPLFIMRHAAKSYIYEIRANGGYGMIFEAHIFPKGQEPLVEEIKGVLVLPADTPRRIPDGILERFVKWHCGVADVNYLKIDGDLDVSAEE